MTDILDLSVRGLMGDAEPLKPSARKALQDVLLLQVSLSIDGAGLKEIIIAAVYVERLLGCYLM